MSIFYSMLTKLFFPTSIVRKNLLLNISITSFSQYTTICFVSFLFIRFSMNICWFVLCHFLCTESNQRNFIMEFLMVGPSGLEPPTSCLSGTRSNLLSYEPMWLVWILFTLRFCPLCLEASVLTFLLEESKW